MYQSQCSGTLQEVVVINVFGHNLLVDFSAVTVYAGVTQVVECQPSKLNVAGSNPVSRLYMFTLR